MCVCASLCVSVCVLGVSVSVCVFVVYFDARLRHSRNNFS